MEERLQKIISAAGIASRRAAEKLIEEGRVRVNGEVASLGDKADEQRDSITVDGRPVSKSELLYYIVLNKPKGYVTTMSDELGRRNVSELVGDVGERVYPVGRLDLNSEGLLIMTNDGDFANAVMHPSGEIPKKYRVYVTGSDVRSAAEGMRLPIEIEGHLTLPAEVTVVRENKSGGALDVVIREGRNRQVRKLCERENLKVTRLIRISEGPVSLGNLGKGEWRYLTSEEVYALTHYKGGSSDGR